MNLSVQEGIRYISCEELRQALHTGSMSIIDLQPDVHDYIKEHIPGAAYINEQHFRMFRDHLPTVYAQQQSLEYIFQCAGISEQHPVIVYSGTGRFSGTGDGLEQTMAAYTLFRFGLKSVYLLDGGLDSWISAGFELEKVFPFIQQTSFKLSIDTSLFVSYSQFCEIKNQKSVLVVDVRPHSVYEGKSIWSKSGHIPGAVNLPWRTLMEHGNARKPKHIASIKEIVAMRDVTPDRDVVLYCGTGREATAAFIIFKHVLNYPSVRIYEGSFTEWCTKTDQCTMTGIEK